MNTRKNKTPFIARLVAVIGFLGLAWTGINMLAESGPTETTRINFAGIVETTEVELAAGDHDHEQSGARFPAGDHDHEQSGAYAAGKAMRTWIIETGAPIGFALILGGLFLAFVGLVVKVGLDRLVAYIERNDAALFTPPPPRAENVVLLDDLPPVAPPTPAPVEVD